jgi:shikimate kinase
VPNIFLTGFMGAGKSTVGKTLSDKLGWTFIDTDRLIEQRTGKSISENFVESEDVFRQLESEIVSEVITGDRQVVALGGGSLIRSSSRLKVLGAGHLIYLKTSSETLTNRLKMDEEVRPLLEKEKDKKSFIEKLLKERESVYQAAHFTIVTDGRTPDSLSHDILVTTGMIRK